ncbi:hypothetical protein [Mycobacterium sp. ITM-2016-00318]|uniref:hypothetical protein n=1 Tax=Mycobacterium sp. ITM-2016-00318 TaxID=2099693 RepID=UPI000CF9F96F|nr:hypothetical protein [Mycobacterium sp. ITM-2016-00318]WNG94984.1 hypothetical protein C6A82_011425 [Mycobacterium sp. ITM-2016-00318]
MKTIAKGLFVGAVLAGAIMVASPASAHPLEGSYSGLLIDGARQVLNPTPVAMSFSACGADCARLQMPRQNVELRLQGGTWVGGYDWNGSRCTITVDRNAQVLDNVCPNDQPMRMTLTKNG